jgi:hypothetical protein
MRILPPEGWVGCSSITVNISVHNIFKNFIWKLQKLKSDETVYAK